MEFRNTKVSDELVPTGVSQLYQGHVVKTDPVTTEMLAQRIADRLKVDVTVVRNILGAFAAQLNACIADGERPVLDGVFTTRFVVNGSFESEDDVWDVNRHSVGLAFDTLVPVKASAAEINSLIKVSNIMDVATEQFGTVIGSTPFAVLGNGITLDAAGEYVKALDKKTGEVKGTATVQSVSKGQRAYAKFDPQLAGGDYTLEIATKGLIGEATPRIFHKPVTAVYAPPVPIAQSSDGTVKVMTFTDDGQSATFTAGNPWLATGSGLVETSAEGLYVDAATVCKDETGGGETCQLTRDATGATLGITLPPLAIPSGTYPNATVRIVLSKMTQSGIETLVLPINLIVNA